MIKRVHIFGASGAGTTTLAKALTEETGYAHFDADRYLFLKFPQLRKVPVREAMLEKDLKNTDKWVLSGALCGWGSGARPYLDLVVFLWAPTELRLARLHARQLQRHGDIITRPGSPEYKTHQIFMKWASGYDTGDFNMRSRKQQERWMDGLSCPVLRLEGENAVSVNMKVILDFMRDYGSDQSP